MPEKQYRWDSPYEWLMEKAKEWSKEELFAALENVAANVESDTLQDIFQDEMDEDGYFRPLGENAPDDEA